MRYKICAAMEERMPFVPTPSPHEAMLHLADFLLSSSGRPTLVMNGYAGTGKTAILRALCDIAEEGGYRLVLMAPTGRAAKVLSAATARQAMTIHRTIYRQESNGYDSHFGIGFNGYRHTLYIVDEASMIGDNFSGETEFGSGRLLTDMVGYIFSQEASRLLIVGDPAQLPPIGMERSSAMDKRILESMGLDVDMVWLTDVVRQELDSDILINAVGVRKLIDQETAWSGGYPHLKAGAESDVVRVSGAELIETLTTAYDTYGQENVLVVTRSNKRASRFNQGIRGSVLMTEEQISRGDLLMVAKNNYMWLSRMQAEERAAEDGTSDFKYVKGGDFIANGDICEVKRVRRYKEMYGLHFADVLLSFIEHDGIDIELRLIMDCLNSEMPKLTTEEERRFYELVEQDYSEIGDKRKRYTAIRNDEWFNALQVKFAYAVTCHKAQGGQWEAVFIDIGYTPAESIDKQWLQWLYTAMTRAKKRLYLVNFPDEFFS